MKHFNSHKFIRTLAILLVIAGLSIACGNLPQQTQPIIAVPLLPDELTCSFVTTKSPTLITATARDLQVTLETVLFELDAANLLPKGFQQIEELAQVILQTDSYSVLIEGYTDSMGNPVYNQELSELRANTVYNALLINGINSEKIVIRGFGAEDPVATNETEEGRQQNRRVEIKLLNESL